MKKVNELAFAELKSSLIGGLTWRAIAVVEGHAPGRTRAGKPYLREDLAV